MKNNITQWHKSALERTHKWFTKKKYRNIDFDSITWANLTEDAKNRIVASETRAVGSKSNVDSIINVFNRSFKQRNITKHIKYNRSSLFTDEAYHTLECVDDLLSHCLHEIGDSYTIDVASDLVS